MEVEVVGVLWALEVVEVLWAVEVAAWRLLWALGLCALGVAASLLWVVGVLWVLWVGHSCGLAHVGPPMAG